MLLWPILLALAQAPDGAQEALIEHFLVEKDPGVRARLLGDIRLPPPAVEAYLRRAPSRPPVNDRGRIVKKRLKANHPLGVEFEYALWIPRDYSPEKQWRLIISLHGQGGNGEEFIQRWLGDVQRDGKTFLLCPSAARGGWGHSTLGQHYILDSIKDVLAGYSIDPDLVFIDGSSMGGNGSFQFACAYPDLFAGAAPRSGGPQFRYLPTGKGGTDRTVTAEGLENLLATPLFWIVGAQDPEFPNAWVRIARAQLASLKSDFTFKEFPEGGHEWFPQENAAVLSWMDTKRRTAYPTRVGLDTNDRANNRNFWLEISEFKGTENLKRRYLDLDQKPIEERVLFSEHARIRGEILKESNEIKVAASGAREIRIYLHQGMLDFSKPLNLTLNGFRSKWDVKPSLEVLMESARRDRRLLYTATVKVKVP